LAKQSHQRLDIQGLRMVAVLTVFANHLWGWPRGGFIGVDVFFVISGFLITGNLLRSAELTGTVSFRKFYWNRVRRIVPAATVVLLLIYLVSTLVFLPFRAHDVGVDALFAFIFFANWHFALQDTDYFAASETVSPIQHFWSLSIEEQFYFVWPALIFVISLLVARKAWNHRHRMLLAGAVMGTVSAASLGWALYETATSPTWAYFNTFTRVWELGVGALLATAVGTLARVPRSVKPWLSWAGLALIGASVFLIADDSMGFPAPWALLPVAGTAAVIAAGVGGEPKFQGFLRNPVSTYIGNFSYSLYLVHWPVIVFLATTMDRGPYYYLAVVTLAFGLSIASYHFVENPLRHINWEQIREATRLIDRAPFRANQSTKYAALGAVALTTAALNPSGAEAKLGPLTTGLQVVLGHSEALLDAPQLVVGPDDELRCLFDEVGGVALQPGQTTDLGLQLTVDALGGAGELGESVAFDRGSPVDDLLGLGDLLGDAAQRAPGPVVAVLVVDDAIGDTACLFAAGGRPGLGEDLPIVDVLIGMLVAPFAHHIGHKRDPGAEDERQPRGFQRDLIGFGDHAGIGDDDDIGEVVGGLGCVDHGQHGCGLGFAALERLDGQREP
jgi:peptidoglycan/LPS O-acetylase OafA/YrhL